MAAETAQMSEAFNMPTAVNSIDVSLQISLSQMLDLALGTPEVGAVNFNILHNFLRILLQQTNLQTTKIEFRGENADNIKRMITSMKPSPALQLREYITDATGEVTQRIRTDAEDVLTEDIRQPEKILTVMEDVRPQIDFEKVPEAQIVVMNNVLPTASEFKELEQSVKQLQEGYQALEDLPPEIERLKDRTADLATDVLQFTNINKRLDDNEQGIDKLTAMVDVIKGDVGAVTADTSSINTKLNELEDKVSNMEKGLINLQAITDILTENIVTLTSSVQDIEEKVTAIEEKVIAEPTIIEEEEEEEEEAEEVPKINDRIRRITPEEIANQVAHIRNSGIEEIRQDVYTLKTDVTHVQQELQDERIARNSAIEEMHQDVNTLKQELQDERIARDSAIEEMRQGVNTLKTDVTHVERELQDLNERIAQNEIPTIQPRIVDLPVEIEPVVREPIKENEKIVEVTDVANLEQCLEVVRNVEATHSKALNDVTQRVVTLETEFKHLSEKVDNIQEADKIDDIEIKNLITKVQKIEMDMEKIEQTMSRLYDDKERQETHINTLLEQIEVLKTVKANKEDIEDALADKADAQAVNRKVSYDQFDAACDDLTRGLEEAIDKLTKQESIWQQALDEVQNEIATKMDKVEMTPLKDFINDKLKSLQEKLRIITEARREIEAAGTKKLLRDVQCISCDKDVVMKTEEVDRFRAKSFPCTTSIKPYLAYELDQVRKQQRRLPHSRNMIQFEAAIQEEARKIKAKEEMLAKIPRDHLCNRYCGGSYTITTPQQRVMRTGHFFTQWGPKAIQLTDGLIKGKDGQVYRSRPMPSKFDVCGPSCWESQISEETDPSECASTVFRKSLPFRRNNAGKQKRNSRKQSKESKVSEPEEKSIEADQVISLQENDSSLIPAKDITTLYKINKDKEIDKINKTKYM